jgi:hypothetical protein
MPFVFKDPNENSASTTSRSSAPEGHDAQGIACLLQNTSLSPGYSQQEVHKLDKSPLGSRTREQTQEERRKKALQLQKRNRQNHIELARRLAFEKVTVDSTLDSDDDEPNAEDDAIVDENMGERVRNKEKNKMTKRIRKQNVYRSVDLAMRNTRLMLS